MMFATGICMVGNGAAVCYNTHRKMRQGGLVSALESAWLLCALRSHFSRASCKRVYHRLSWTRVQMERPKLAVCTCIQTRPSGFLAKSSLIRRRCDRGFLANVEKTTITRHFATLSYLVSLVLCLRVQRASWLSLFSLRLGIILRWRICVTAVMMWQFVGSEEKA